MRWIVPVAAIFLAGCGQSAGEKAEAEYRMAEKAIIDPAGKRCEAARKVAAAYAEDGNEEAYLMWDLHAYNDCAEANRY